MWLEGRQTRVRTLRQYYLEPYWYSSLLYISFENLTLDEATSNLYAMLQFTTIQDGGKSKATSHLYTGGLLAWDVSNPSNPVSKGEWIVPLPVNKGGSTLGFSEIYFVSDNVFLALSRDGDARRGGDIPTSKYNFLLCRLFLSLDFLQECGPLFHRSFDGHSWNDQKQNPQGTLVQDSSITPAKYIDFVKYLDTTSCLDSASTMVVFLVLWLDKLRSLLGSALSVEKQVNNFVKFPWILWVLHPLAIKSGIPDWALCILKKINYSSHIVQSSFVWHWGSESSNPSTSDWHQYIYTFISPQRISNDTACKKG